MVSEPGFLACYPRDHSVLSYVASDANGLWIGDELSAALEHIIKDSVTLTQGLYRATEERSTNKTC